MFKELTGSYNPSEFESSIYDFWLGKKYFHGITGSQKPPFSIVIPPPNVTGYLHMGHAPVSYTHLDVYKRQMF